MLHMLIYTVTDARANLPEILGRVEAGDEVTVTRHGRPVAVIVRPDALRSRRAAQVIADGEQISQLLEDMKGQPRPAVSLSNDRAEEILVAIRADRDRALNGRLGRRLPDLRGGGRSSAGSTRRGASRPSHHGPAINIGSTVLIPELLSKPIREEQTAEIRQLAFILSRLELHPVDRSVGSLAAVLGARYRLRSADAIHLATAVVIGADRFITNNRRDFDREQIVEIDITYPDML